MKSHLRKNLVAASILTIAFAVALAVPSVIPVRNDHTWLIFSCAIMAVGIMIGARYWSKPDSKEREDNP
jgi:uncharacterized membrane protein YfcA